MCETDFESEYKEKILDSELWIAKAEQLLEVAGLIEPEIEKMWAEMREGGFIKERYITTYFMLSSYALENLLKALYIKTNYQKIEAGLKESCELPKSIKGHDLWKLAKELNVVQKEWGEETLLKKLSRSAVWFGRYPTPLKPKDLKRFHDSEDENTPIPLSFTSYMNTDLEEIRAIISRIKSKLNQSIP